MTHSAAWFDRQLAHCRECLAEADKAHTAEEIAAAKAALSLPQIHPQATLPLDSARPCTIPEH